MGGRTWWGASPSYRIEDIVNRDRIIALESGRVASNPHFGVRARCSRSPASVLGFSFFRQLYVEGRLRLFDLFPRGPVFVRFTLDYWSTWADSPAQLIHVR